MSQLVALIYKNTKLVTRQKLTTIFQITSPLFCILCVLLLQILAKQQSEQQTIKPPFEIPFGGLYPINIPLDLFPKVKDWGAVSCLRMNKYGFTKNSDSQSSDFVDNFLGFKRLSGIRNFICKAGSERTVVSPHFNRTETSTHEGVNEEILDEMEDFYGTRMNDVWKTPIPTDGYFLFDHASQHKVKATLFSNNMNVQFYHRANMQTMMAFNNFAVW